MSNFLFKDRDGQTPLPNELEKGLKLKHIQTMGELDEYEEQNIAEGLAWLKKQSGEWKDYLFWKALHRKLFKDVWEWAGEWRLHDLQNIQASLKHLEGDLHHWIKDHSLSNEGRVVRFHERLVAIHPFANGNGRWSRILAEHFSESLGLRLPTWGQHLKGDPAKRRQTYLKGLREVSRSGKYQALTEFIFS